MKNTKIFAKIAVLSLIILSGIQAHAAAPKEINWDKVGVKIGNLFDAKIVKNADAEKILSDKGVRVASREISRARITF